MNDISARRSVPRLQAIGAFLAIYSLAFGPTASAARSQVERAGVRNVANINTATGQLGPAAVFSNPLAINIADAPATASSVITVSGMSGPVSALTVTLNNLTIAQTRDLDMLLVGPGGQKYVFFSDAGGLFNTTSNVTLTLSDAAASQLPTSGSLATGTFRPTNVTSDVDNFAGAPAGPYSQAAPQGSDTFTSVFGGLSGASVNGNWTLYIADDTGGGTSSVAGGWSLDITTTPAAAATTTTLTSSLNPSNRNQAVTFTSTTTSSSTVNTGTVTFVDITTATTLCSNVPVNGIGVATCLVGANTLSERTHTIQATYAANATFATSNGTVNQMVNFPTSQSGNTFTNAGGITIVEAGTSPPSIPYPSNIIVSGLTGTISKVTLTLTNVSFPQTADHNFLLVGPGGQRFVFMSDAGGTFTATLGATLTFDDAAGNALPNSGAIPTGTYRPTDYTGDVDAWPAPAPAGPHAQAAPAGSGTFASVFGGAAPNGTWSLYPLDDTGGGGASTIGSWSLTFTTSGDVATTTVVTATPNPATTAQPVAFSATVASGGNPVTTGTVTFRNGATILCAAVALNGGGQATCNQPAFTQGDRVITADYNGAPGQFNISSGSVTLQVNSPTVVTGNNYANNGGITIQNASSGNPYPSRIIVSNLGGTISKVTVTLNGVTTPTPEDLDLLLVGPNGQKFLFMGDAGGSNFMSNVTLTLDDAAASPLPDSTAIVSGTYRPASYTGSDIFPAPAPAGPYNPAAPEGSGTFANIFNGSVPNGTWSLYAVEDAGDAVNATISGWSLTFTLAPASTTTSVSSSVNPSAQGQSVTLTTTVSPVAPTVVTPTGTVSFFQNGNPIAACSNVALNGSGQATCTNTFAAAGNYNITVQYSGGTNFSASDNNAAPLVQQVLAPTAGDATLTGRVVTADGRGISRARLWLTAPDGSVRVAIANTFGYFRFFEVPAGEAYILTVESKSYRFDQPSVALQVTDDLAGITFVGHR